MTVIGKRSPCLYLDLQAFILFSALLQLRKGSETAAGWASGTWSSLTHHRTDDKSAVVKSETLGSRYQRISLKGVSGVSRSNSCSKHNQLQGQTRLPQDVIQPRF